MGRHVPAADDHRADDDAADDHLAGPAKVAIGEYVSRQRDRHDDGNPELRRGAAPQGDHDRRQVGRRGAQRPEVEAHRIEPVHPPQREYAAQRHVRRDREEDEDDERLEVAAADPDQRLAAASRPERHAEAEQEAADEQRQPAHAAAGVDRFGQIDETRRLQRAGADDRHGDGEQPHPHPTPVAEVHDVGHGAHRAEVDAVGDGTEDDREAEREAADQGWQVSGSLHAAIIPRANIPPGCGTALTPHSRCPRLQDHASVDDLAETSNHRGDEHDRNEGR